MLVEPDVVPLIRINAPELYTDKHFQEWLNDAASPECADRRGFPTATWHRPGEIPSDMSDVFMVVHGPDGSDSDMPEHCWKHIQQALSSVGDGMRRECVVWLTNLVEFE